MVVGVTRSTPCEGRNGLARSASFNERRISLETGSEVGYVSEVVRVRNTVKRRGLRWGLVALALLACARFAPAAPAPDSAAVDREFEFAAGLIRMNLPEYAETVVNKLCMVNTNLQDRANVIRAEALIARRRFKPAEDLVATMPKGSPKAQAIMLALADGYYQTGEYDKCRGLYQQFFNQYTNAVPQDPDLLRFYRDAAYKFAQMLSARNDLRRAADLYDLVIRAADDTEIQRQARVEQAEMVLRAARTLTGPDRDALLAKAETNCNEVLWSGTDLWFGRGVISLAHILRARGQKDEAMRLLQSNLKVLRKLDDLMEQTGVPISESPLAGARSLLGSLFQQEADVTLARDAVRQAEALGYYGRALNEYSNVWGIVSRVAARDAAYAAKLKAGEVKVALPGTAEERQQPFVDLSRALEKFADEIASATGQGAGWDGSVADRANALKAGIAGLQKTVQEFSREHGVTPSADMGLGEAFRGNEYLAHGRQFLRPEAERKERGVDLYTRALQEFYNVFAGYAGSDWSTEAGEKVESLKERLKELTGKEITIEAKKGGRERIALVSFKEGESLFSRKEYPKAVEAFRRGLKDLPEGNESLVALGSMMECYAVSNDVVRVRMVAQYLVERFPARPEVPQALLRVGRFYFEAKNRELYAYLYDLYLEKFPDHAMAPAILYMLAEQRWAAKDYEGAVAYYRRLTARYPKTQYYLKALNRIGWSYYLAGQATNAVDGFRAYMADAQPSAEKAAAKLCLADACRQVGDQTNALTHYRDLVQWLTPSGNPYSSSAEDLAKNQEVLQQARFFEPYCQSMIREPPDLAAASRAGAVDGFRTFVAAYPQSKLAPLALSSLGAVLLSDGKSEDAAKVFEELSASYPQSEAGQNARLAMIRSLIEIAQNERARQVLGEMVRDADKYPAEQLTKVGLLVLEKNEFASAVDALGKALERLRATPTTPENAKSVGDLEQRILLGLGKARYGVGKLPEAAAALQELVDRYPRSGFFYEARFVLGRTYRKMGKTTEAVEVLKDVFKRASDQVLINQATMELAEIQTAQGDKTDALASYARIVLLGKFEDPAVRPLYRDALLRSLPIQVEQERWTDVVDYSHRFMAEFPMHERAAEVRRWREKALMSLSTGGAKAVAP
jgi:TolA-binding protein